MILHDAQLWKKLIIFLIALRFAQVTRRMTPPTTNTQSKAREPTYGPIAMNFISSGGN